VNLSARCRASQQRVLSVGRTVATDGEGGGFQLGHPELVDLVGWSRLKLAYDGLEREFKFFKELESGVCMMCAPGDLENPVIASLSS
jgi:hypothetical protein